MLTRPHNTTHQVVDPDARHPFAERSEKKGTFVCEGCRETFKTKLPALKHESTCSLVSEERQDLAKIEVSLAGVIKADKEERRARNAGARNGQ